MKSLDMFPPVTRLANAAVSGATYLVMVVRPRGLAVFYPHRGGDLEVWKIALSTLLLLAVTAAVVSQTRRRPYLATGCIWYLVVLVPVSGLVQLGMQSMADRYTYVSLVGIFIILAWGVPDLVPGGRFRKPALAVGTGITLVLLAALTSRQLGFWENSGTLYRHTLSVTSDNWLAHNNLGKALSGQGLPEEAAAHYRAALRIRPEYAEANSNIGNYLARQGRYEEAAAHYRRALSTRPDHAIIYYNQGNTLLRQQRFAEAAETYLAPVRLDPGLSSAYYNLGNALLMLGRPRAARGR